MNIEELEIGMYVRTKDYSHYRSKIGKIDGLVRTPNTYHLDCEESHCITTIDSIEKASYNIIDLIEEGDYVNGYKVVRVDEKCSLYPKTLKAIYNAREDMFDIFNEDIKEILTKEEYENNVYKVGDK
jgi:hypothetical protein